MADEDQKLAPTIVIKKIKKGGHGHHGGAWKVAYADFVTAMMAFFLLMWLLNASDEKTRRGISNYFSPIGTTNSGEGSGGLFGGMTIQAEGALQDSSAQPMAGPNFGMSENAAAKGKDGAGEKFKNEGTPSMNEEEFQAMLVAQEEKLFQQIEEEIRKTIAAIPELAKLGENLIIDITPEGLRIQLVDRNKVSMFPSGSKVMFDHTFKLLNQVAKAIAKTDNKLSIYGHTDANPFRNEFNYSNWELSSDRAHATRRALMDAKVAPSRIDKVVGKAAQEPLLKNDPASPQNRRISVVLMRKVPKASKSLKLSL